MLNRPQFWFSLVVLVPCFAWYTVFAYRPVLWGFWISVLDYQVTDPSASQFVGLGNFKGLFTYDRFWIAMSNTTIYSVLIYAFSIPAALLIASCISNVLRGRRLYEFVVFLPVVVSLVAVAMMFRMLMNPQSGTFNDILGVLHLPTSQWIFGSDSALLSVVLVDAWKGLGFYVVILTTAMLAVPQPLYDAAKVDGANGWQLFSRITIPTIMPTLALVSIMAIFIALQVYVSPVVLGPGPGTSTLMLNQFIVDQAFTSFNMGYAAAASLVLFAIILVLTVVQLRVLRPRN